MHGAIKWGQHVVLGALLASCVPRSNIGGLGVAGAVAAWPWPPTWRPVLERHLDRSVSGVMKGHGINLSIARARRAVGVVIPRREEVWRTICIRHAWSGSFGLGRSKMASRAHRPRQTGI